MDCLAQPAVLQSLNNDDKSVKASLYETDCGVMTPTRSSLRFPPGTLMGGAGVHMCWRTNRELVITYPAKIDIEFAVSKIRGVKIYLRPQTP